MGRFKKYEIVNKIDAIFYSGVIGTTFVQSLKGKFQYFLIFVLHLPVPAVMVIKLFPSRNFHWLLCYQVE